MAVLSTLANVATPGLPVGSIQAFAGANAPTGWLLCDGSAVSRGNYPDLYNTIGNTYGSGDGSTTFNLPDLRGRMPIGPNSDSTAANTATRSVGTKGGDTRLQSHTHPTDTKPIDARSQYSGTSDNNALFGAGDASVAITFWGFTGTYRQTTNRPSGDGSGGNMPPFLVTNYIIKAVADIARGGWYTQSSPPVVTQLPSNPAIGEEVYHFSSNKYVHKRYNGTSWDEFAINQSSLPPGSVVQVGRYGWTNETSVNGSGAGWVNATNSSYTFTPQFSNSTILIQFEWAMAPYNTGGQYTGMSCRGLWAGNVVTVQGANGGATHEVYFANAASNGADLYTRTVKSASFTSNTTSPTIITTQVAAYVGTTNARLNQNVNWPSYYTVWEIKG